jgi:hypothetical protein
MNATIAEIFALSILIAGVIAIVRFKKIDPMFYPFILLIWIGCVNEVLGVILVFFKFHTLINNNIYVVCESLTILWFFKKTGTVSSGKAIFLFLAFSFVAVWLTENFILGWDFYASSYFRIYYSFIIVLLSVTTVNYLIVEAKKNLLKMSIFLISIGFIIYFTYEILVQTFSLYGLNNSLEFQKNVYMIMIYLNLIVNILYALAILWIPRKRDYSLLSL